MSNEKSISLPKIPVGVRDMHVPVAAPLPPPSPPLIAKLIIDGRDNEKTGPVMLVSVRFGFDFQH